MKNGTVSKTKANFYKTLITLMKVFKRPTKVTVPVMSEIRKNTTTHLCTKRK